MEELKITDIIDRSVLQEIQDSFSDFTGMAAVCIDKHESPLTEESRFTEFCGKYTRQSRIGCSICDKCGRNACEQAMTTGQPAVCSCHAGLTDFAVPITADGEYLGAFIGGQVLTDQQPDEEIFRSIAGEIDVDPDEYIEALGKVTVTTRANVTAAAEHLHKVIKALMDSAYENYKAKLSGNELSAVNQAVIDKITEAENAVARSYERINVLAESFGDVKKIAESTAAEVTATTGTVKVIQNIALNTKILGFNASIEASRAKESGKGFGVIAQEVRNLAETSKSSADLIEKAMQKIGAHSRDMTAKVAGTKDAVEQCRADLEEFSGILDEMKARAEK